MASIGKKGTLFLMEFMVKKLNFLKNALKNRPECRIGKLVVFIKFLHFPIEIEEETNGKLIGKGEFKKGRSCLFSITNTPPPNLLDVEFYIIRKRPDGVIPDVVALGRTKVNFSCHFINIMKLSRDRPQELPICKAIQDTFEVTDIRDPRRPIGTLTLIMRATCLGKLIVTQLQKSGDSSILLKGNKDRTLYVCESVSRKIPTGPTVRDNSKPPCGEVEKDLAEEFKNIIGGRKSVCEDCASIMKADTCENHCTLDRVSFKSFYDDCNRLCLVYQRDGSCCIPDWSELPLMTQEENDMKLEYPFDDRGNEALPMVNPEPNPPLVVYQAPFILKENTGNFDTFKGQNPQEALVAMTDPSEGPSTHALWKRGCKDCKRLRYLDFDFCPQYPAPKYRELTENEKMGIVVCEAPCQPPPPGPPKKEEKWKPVERVPRTAAIGRAVLLDRLMKSHCKPGGHRASGPRRQPVKFLKPLRRWEGGESVDPEPPEWTARFPALQPLNSSTDIHIRTPTQYDENVFVMKMLTKVKKKPVLQLELRSPRRPLPGELPPPPPKPPTPPPDPAPPAGKKGKGKGKKGKGKKKKK